MNGTLTLGIYGINDISYGENPILIHDHNLALFERGKLVDYVHLERISRRKYDASLPGTLESLLRAMGIAGRKDVKLCIADHEIGKSLVSHQGQVRFEPERRNTPLEGLHPGRAYWFGQEVEAWSVSHEMAHLYSCIPFFGAFREQSLLVHYDGGASKSNFSAWAFEGGELRLIYSHNKFRRLTNLFNANALAFRLTGTAPGNHNSVPGKLMGLASFGQYSAQLEAWLKAHDFFADIWNSSGVFLNAVRKDWQIDLAQIDSRNSFCQDIAATMHEIFLRESEKEILNLASRTGYRNLYFTGGCALSIKLNAHLWASGKFDEVFIPPCTNDSGLGLGAAVALSLKDGYRIPSCSPYLNGHGLERKNTVPDAKEAEIVAAKLAEGLILGVCNDFGEAGPRALGNRSILCRADSKALAEKVSRECKGREWYRPVAPVMLVDEALKVTGLSRLPESAKYMLFDFPVLEKFKNQLAGAVHVDETARIQIIADRQENPFLFDVLTILKNKYSIAALINTSFNAGGEPIVHTHKQAEASASQMKLDGLVLNGRFKEI